MITFTDKELIKEIKERIGSLDVRDNIERRAYEIALASLEAEPMAWQVTITKDGQDSASTIYRDCAEKDTWVRIHETLGSVVHVTPLYMAPPAPVIQADVAQAIENLKQKLVECNRYNYCADAVKDVEDASRVVALQNQNMSAPITPEAIENAIEYIRSIAFHIDEDDYHGKHIAHFMRQALTWLEGDSYRDGNCPVTLDAWISCSEQMPDDGRIQFSVSLPAACGGDKYFIDGVFQPLRYERDCEKAVVAAGGVVNWVK